MRYVLAIDQGTTSTRTILFGPDGAPLSVAQREFKQIYPHPGWIEHDPSDIWETTLATMRDALQSAALRPPDIAAIGIANQRETTLIWNRETGEPIYNAIVWQDRRTADLCARMVADGYQEMITERTGLLIDPYFSATKICWILDNVPGARARAEKGELAFGTVDTYLLWRLTLGAVHATDATNASRTLLFNIRTGCWDEELLRLFKVAASLLPQVRDTAGEFGVAAAEHLGNEIAIRAVAGDQQAALIGQACLEPGMVKATYGTGGFVLLNTGSTAVRSRHRLLTTIAYQWNGTRHYALEGSIFVAGAAVQWLRDALGIIASSTQAGELAAQADTEQPVYFVPAFVGLGAPYWNSGARGTITGLTRGTTRKELARAVLESVGYQTCDLLAAMYADAGETRQPGTMKPIIRVDGGMSASDWTMQFLADVLDVQVDRPTIRETTALGVALLAGWQAGVYPAPDAFATIWRLDRSFQPTMPENIRDQRCRGWRDAMARTLLPPAN
ncbi:MAG TPA: glycerol kinase GlpK [Xanthobacteraceae bacterium]|nr:glycerol kinase GlpK [Xanthobacteraceae bacterium]